MKIVETVKNYENDEAIQVIADTKKLEQKSRNRLKQDLVNSLLEDLKQAFEGTDIEIFKLEKGIGICFPTPAGPIPALIDITMKNTGIDLSLMQETYDEKQKAKAEKRAESMRIKQIKMESDAIKRDKKRAERAAKEAKREEMKNVQN